MSQVSFIDMFASGIPQDLPYSGPSSPPDSDAYMIDDFDPCETIHRKEIANKAERSIHSDGYEDLVATEDALFSQYLRSRSPSYSSMRGFGDDNDGSVHSTAVNLSEICLFAEKDPYRVGLIDQDTIEPKDVAVKATKPRITLRIR